MRNSIRQGFFVLVLIVIAASAIEVKISLDSPLISYSGRIDYTSGAPRFDWSGVSVTISFIGTSLSVTLSDNGNLYNIFVDGQQVNVLQTTSGAQVYPVAQGLTDGLHVITLYKRTEASLGIVEFQSAAINTSLHFENFQKYEEIVDWSVKMSVESGKTVFGGNRKIEFIGDSITCGYGNEGVAPCKWSPQTENNYLAYGPLTARHFDAEFHLEAWSGKGLVRNYGYPNVTSPNPLPSYYPHTLANDWTTVWDFKSWIPDVVVIGLGTNDFSTEPSPPESVFVPAYLSFAKSIREVYPDAHIFLFCGPMIGTPCCTYVQSVVSQLQQVGDIKAHYVDMHVLSESTDWGCDGHPSTQGDAKMAKQLIQAISQNVEW